MSSSQQPGADDERLPDEVWEKFQNDSWSKIDGSAPKEPSARWYEVSERLAGQESGDSRRSREADAGRRGARPERRRARRPRMRMPEEPVPRAVVVGLIILTVALSLSVVFAWLGQHGIVFL